MPRILHFGAAWLAWGSLLWFFVQPFTLLAQNPVASAALPHLAPGSASLPALAPRVPVSEAHTLAGRSVTLPAPGRLTLIIASVAPDGTQTAADWWAQANSLCARHAVMDCYQAHVLGEAAKALPRFSDHAFKDRVQPDFWDRFALVSSNGAAWKHALRPRSPSVRVTALLMAPDGAILWQASGTRGDSLPQELEQALLAAAF